MSHSKKRKRGHSLYLEKWHPASKNFLCRCVLCGKEGYRPSIEEEGFVNPSVNTTDYVHSAIVAELTSVYQPLQLDALGRCELCAALTDQKSE